MGKINLIRVWMVHLLETDPHQGEELGDLVLNRYPNFSSPNLAWGESDEIFSRFERTSSSRNGFNADKWFAGNRVDGH